LAPFSRLAVNSALQFLYRLKGIAFAALVAAGLLACLAGLFLQFPVGCNLIPPDKGCSANPVSWWSTFWPNITGFGLGILSIALGTSNGRLLKRAVLGSGPALIIDGIMLNFPSLIVGWFTRWKDLPYYFTSCPANGCPPLTTSKWWGLFWPGIVAGSIGILLFVSGATLVLVSKGPLRRRTWVFAAFIVTLVCLFMIATIIDDNSISFLAGI